MIRPHGFRAAAFGTASDGDGRTDLSVRSVVSRRLGIPTAWATVSQVHGSTASVADTPRHLGAADAIVTETKNLPVAVATADCLPVVIEGTAAVAVVHAGWRGLAAGVVERAVEAMATVGDEPLRAAIGPAIGPCCYEVGDEVAARFGRFVSETTWGTTSVDLAAAAADALGGIDVWRSHRCTRTDPVFHSHRRDGTKERQVTVAWLPNG